MKPNPLPLNSLEPEDFEFFCCDLLNQYEGILYYKRGIRGQSQRGFDLISHSTQKRVECKRKDSISSTEFKGYIKTFIDSNKDNPTGIKKLIFCFSCEFIRTKEVDEIAIQERELNNKIVENKTFIELQKTELQKHFLEIELDILDKNRISDMIFEKRLFGIVARYFSETIFREFFGEAQYELYFGKRGGEYQHYNDVLKPKRESHFLTEVTENLIKDKKVYFNEEVIAQIDEKLATHNKCLISGFEGRGKTVISRIVAYRKYCSNKEYYNEGFEVFFIDIKNLTNVSKIKDKILEWQHLPQKYLIIFENAHSNTNAIKELLDEIDSIYNTKNLFFIFNSRFFGKSNDEDYSYDPFEGVWREQYVVDLAPSSLDIEEIINLYATHTVKTPIQKQNVQRFIEDKIFRQNENGSANLRLLNIYLETWKSKLETTKGTFTTLDNIEENDILRKFDAHFDIPNLKKNVSKLKALAFLSAIYQFDVPLEIDMDSNPEAYEFLNELVLKGLCSVQKNEFSLAHSVDAEYLFKAICWITNDDYYQRTEFYIKQYFLYLLKKPKPEYEKFISQIMRELVTLKINEDKFLNLLDELTDIEKDEWVTEIATKLNVGFLLPVLVRNWENEKIQSTVEYYKKNKVKFKYKILHATPLVAATMNNLLFKYYNYHSFTSDLFLDIVDLKAFLNRLYIGGGYFKNLINSISSIGEEHADIISNFKPEKETTHNDFPRNYYFNSQKSYGNIEVTSDFVNSLYYHGGGLAFKAKKLLPSLLIHGFYFKMLDWGKISKLMAAIKKFQTEPSKSNLSIKLTNQVIEKVLQYPESIPRAEDNELSLFLTHIESIDYSLYQDLCGKELIIRDVKRRIDKFSYELNLLYLLGHFVKAENIWATSFANKIIANADFSQKNLLKGFYTKIKMKYMDLAKGSLVSLIEEKLIPSTP